MIHVSIPYNDYPVFRCKYFSWCVLKPNQAYLGSTLTLGWNDTDGSNETEGWLDGLALGVAEGEADGLELGLTETDG